jgi:hypothetical protein
MHINNKALVVIFITSAFISASIFFGVLFVYDPLRIFHKPWKYKEYLQGNMRQQAAGIINNWEYDSIILGTSMLETTSSKEASKELGGKFINISISGSDYFERAIVLNYALKNKNLKRVLFSLDTLSSTNLKEGNKVNTWNYLYDNNPVNDFKAYINNKYLKCLFSISNKKKCMGTKTDFDRPNSWHKSKNSYVRFGGLDNWFNTSNNKQIKSAFKSILGSIEKIRLGKKNIDGNLKQHILNLQNYFDGNIIKFVSKYSETEFILIIPPYSRIQYAINAQLNISGFERYKASIKYLVRKSKKYPNLKIYGWGNHSFLDDISNYKDLHHYEYKINSWMLSAIKRKEGVLTIDDIDSYLDVFTRKALDCNLFELGDKIDEYLHLQN